jgi:mannosyltransferase OCH1-like enzyme
MRSLDAMNQYPLWLHLTNPTGISNDAMGSVPGHPFWADAVLPSLPSHAYRFPLPYVTVMASTGPLFLSALWKRWIDSPRNVDSGRIRVVHREEFSGADGIFKIFAGSSWHGGDVRVLRWVLAHAVFVGFVTALAVVVVGYWTWGYCQRCRHHRVFRKRRDGKAYELVDRHEV